MRLPASRKLPFGALADPLRALRPGPISFIIAVFSGEGPSFRMKDMPRMLDTREPTRRLNRCLNTEWKIARTHDAIEFRRRPSRYVQFYIPRAMTFSASSL